MGSESFEAELIGIVAHDLKAPISALRGFIELIQQVGPLNDQQTHFANRAMLSLQRMESMIIGLLDFARLEGGLTPQLERTHILPIVEREIDILSELAVQRHLKLHLSADANIPPAMIDPDLVGHVISNLISNAIKYNREGGEIWVSVENQRQVIRVNVRDSGLGIPAKKLPFIFDRFVRAHEDRETTGSGLGLAICRSIIDMHGGNIWAESKEGEGSIFSFTLPFRPRRGHTMQPKALSPGEAAGETDDPIDDDTQESPDESINDSQDEEPMV
ncbi:MAG: hypothetical protein OHK0046_03810 [Anaerolineae bacterium]